MTHPNDFDTADLHGKMTFFGSALDSGKLNADDAFKMLDAIHAELDALQGHDHNVYAHYAALIEKLEHQHPDLYRQVVHAYAQVHSAPQTGTKLPYRALLQPEEIEEEDSNQTCGKKSIGLSAIEP